jgi:hypothetical protein
MGPMRNTRHCSAVIAALTIVASTTISLGQVAPQPVTGNEFAAATNMLHRGMKVEGRLFVPATATRIRAVTVLIDYGNTWRLYQSEIWRKSAESTESALLLARVSSFNVIPPTPYPPERQVMRVASLGGSEGLLTVMQRLATESGHPELQSVPLAFWGWSAAAGFGPTFAKEHPQRTLAFIRYHTNQRGILVDLDTTKVIPALLLAGGKDTSAGVEDTESLWRRGSASGAPWSFVIEPNVPHGIIDGNAGIEFFTNSSQLMLPWLTAIMRQRLPQLGAPMQPIDKRVGWLGDIKTGEIRPSASFSGSTADKTWLPDEESARAWQRLRVVDNPGRPFA